MKPREFVGRVLDFFEFDCSPVNPRQKAGSFFNATTLMRSSRGAQNDYRRIVDGFLFVIETQDVLRHTVLQATMVPGGTMETPMGNTPIRMGIRASVCWNVHAGYMDQDRLLETFEIPNKYEHDGDEIIGMIGYLTLKTRYQAKNIMEKL